MQAIIEGITELIKAIVQIPPNSGTFILAFILVFCALMIVFFALNLVRYALGIFDRKKHRTLSGEEQ